MNYKIEAIKILLNTDCVLTRYYSLIPYKEKLVNNLIELGCTTKDECLKLDDELLIKSGLPNIEDVRLFKSFLNIYDINKSKFKEINTFCTSKEEENAFYQLYLLPGIKKTRATLYYKSGYDTLKVIANSSAEEIIFKISGTIDRDNLELKVPLLKEVKTHIAVAKAFSLYSVE